MTTPSQVAPDGAFTIGGPWAFGQNYTEDVIGTLVGLKLPTFDDAIDQFQEILSRVPLSGLLVFRPLCPNSVDADWENSKAAAAAIMDALHVRDIAMTLEYFQNWLDTVFQPFKDLFQGLLDGLWQMLGKVGTGKNLQEVLAALTSAWNWLYGGFTELVNGLWTIIGKVGTGKNITDLLAEMTKVWNWLYGGFNNLIQGLWSIFGGLGTVNSIQDLLDQIKKLWDFLFGGFQGLIDGIANLFGLTGLQHTVQEAVGALDSWLKGVFKPLSDLVNWLIEQVQKLVDGIAGVFKPIVGAVGRPIQDALDAIEGIMGIGQKAGESAGKAISEIEDMKSVAAGGFSDLFETAASNNLSADWRKYSSLADSYGPDGAGAADLKASGIGMGWVEYCNTGKPISSSPNMKVTSTFSRAPRWDVGSRSEFRLTVQNNASNKECYGVELAYDTYRFFYQDKGGTQSFIGAPVKMPVWDAGVPFALEIKGTTLNFYRAKILQGSASVTHGVLTGRCVGFGSHKVPWLIGYQPCGAIAGMSWQPVV
jgi:hypothetical protein